MGLRTNQLEVIAYRLINEPSASQYKMHAILLGVMFYKANLDEVPTYLQDIEAQLKYLAAMPSLVSSHQHKIKIGTCEFAN